MKGKPTNDTYTECRYSDLAPNPLNPRRIFDKLKLDVLEESIRANKILVPLTVYRDRKDGGLYILDGERRWRCAERIEKGEVSVTLHGKPNDLRIPPDLEDLLSYEASTSVLTHRVPVDSKAHERLTNLSSSRAWATAINKLYALSRERPPKPVVVPVNIVDPPSPAANLLYMFHVHNLREQWELMPTALSLEILMKELGADDDAKLAELTNLSEPNVKRCKILLSFPKRYQSMMLEPDPKKRLKANLFIEMHPVLDLYEKFGQRVSRGKTRDELTDLFIQKYRDGLIPSVIHFRKILEANSHLEDAGRVDEVKSAAARFVSDPNSKIKSLFDPLVAEEKEAQSAVQLCKEFVVKLRKLKVQHTTKRRTLIAALESVKQEVTRLLDSLAGEE